MNTKPTAMLIILVMGMMVVMMGLTSSPEETSKVSGEDIYRVNCAACHGTDRSGYSNVYPSLINVLNKLTRDEVLNQINNGKGKMPSFAHLSIGEKEALITFLFEGKSEVVESPVENIGERIFMSNCAACHRKTVNDPRPPNARMMEPAPLAGATKRFSKAEFFNILENGICYMPSFNHFTADEREAVYSFVDSIENNGETTLIRGTMGKMCPGMRGKKMRMGRGKGCCRNF